MKQHSENELASLEQLLADLAAGSDAAMEEIIERYATNIVRAVRRHLPKAVRSKFDSHDVFQSLWISVLKKPEGIAQLRNPESVVNYLIAMARNKTLEKYRGYTAVAARDVRRERRIHKPVESATETLSDRIGPLCDETCDSPSQEAVAHETWQRLLALCDDRDREVIGYRLAGMTYDQIAVKLNSCTRTVRRILNRIETSLGP